MSKNNEGNKALVALLAGLSVVFAVVAIGSVIVTTASVSRLNKIEVHKIDVEVPASLGGISNFGLSVVTSASTTISNDATTTILAANTGREYAIITNTSSTGSMYLNFGGALGTSDTGGIYLAAEGSYEIDQDNPYIGLVTGWTTGGTSTITTIEK